VDVDDSVRGRPRDPRIDDAVLQATRELLASEGFAATTVLSVARRAGVPASAIYRRWPSRLELIATATTPDLDKLAVEPTGDLRTDLRRFVQAYLEQFDAPVNRAALPGMLAIPTDSDEYRALMHRVGQGIRPAFRAALAAAPAGSVDPAVDPDTVLDVVIGTALYRVFIHPFTGRSGDADDVTDLLLRALRPDAGPAPGRDADPH
jgi:AcrR family transcriptional regulator